MRVDRLIRACTPGSGRLDRVPRQRGSSSARCGSRPDAPRARRPASSRATKDEVLVGTGHRPGRLGEVQPQGKRAMTAAEWARGARLDPRATRLS